MLSKQLKYFLLFLVLVLAKPSFQQSFTNPILAGFYPDPTICKAGNDYYLVTSSFAYFPGLPIFHSKDLLNWKQIGHVLDRPEQLNLDGAGVSRGLFAPAIAYHKGTFYLVCTLVDKLGNFVVTTKDPKAGWSNPVALPEIDGIDPSIFFDDNDNAYIVYNSIPPDNISLHNGHRTIRINSFDAKDLKVISGNKIIVNGGTDMAKKPVWIEAPHLIKKDGWYYLVCAEGGTAYEHSEVVFRSKTVNGPYTSYENNPILTQRHLDPKRKNAISTTGHADFTEGPDGKWWAVFLGCRPYDVDYYNTGRETFMAPVEWKDGWPTINLGGEVVKYSYPIKAKVDKQLEKLNGNFLFTDNFLSPKLNVRYVFLRTKREDWYWPYKKHGIQAGMNVALRPETISGTGNPSFIGFRQPHLKGYATTSLRFEPANENEQAGLLIFQNEFHYYYLCKSIQDGNKVVQLFKGPGNENKTAKPELLATHKLTPGIPNLHLKIEVSTDSCNFYFSEGELKENWKLLKGNVDGKFLSTKVAKGFVGSLYALYATSNGQPANNNSAVFWRFVCKSEDDVYK